MDTLPPITGSVRRWPADEWRKHPPRTTTALTPIVRSPARSVGIFMGEAVVIVDDDEAEVADAAEAVEEVAEAVEAVAEAAEAVADAAGEVGGESAITEANALLELVTRELDQRLEPIVSRLAEVELRAGMAEITAEAALEEATVPDMPEPVEVEVTEDEVPPADQGHWYSKKRWFT